MPRLTRQAKIERLLAEKRAIELEIKRLEDEKENESEPPDSASNGGESQANTESKITESHQQNEETAEVKKDFPQDIEKNVPTNKHTNIVLSNSITFNIRSIIKSGLPGFVLGQILDSIPRNGCVFLEAPSLNDEVADVMEEYAIKRDASFVLYHTIAASALSNVSRALYALQYDKKEILDRETILNHLSDSVKLLAHLLFQFSKSRRFYIMTKLANEILRPPIDKLFPDELLRNHSRETIASTLVKSSKTFQLETNARFLNDFAKNNKIYRKCSSNNSKKKKASKKNPKKKVVIYNKEPDDDEYVNSPDHLYDIRKENRSPEPSKSRKAEGSRGRSKGWRIVMPKSESLCTKMLWEIEN